MTGKGKLASTVITTLTLVLGLPSSLHAQKTPRQDDSSYSENTDGFGTMMATSGEIGIKADLADRKVRINATAFYTDYDDLQVTQFVAGSNGTTNETVNVGRATYKGIELEVAAWGNNLLNKHVIVGGIDYGSLGFGGVTYNRQRNCGLNVRESL